MRPSRTAAASSRLNEYFVPKEGIDREVITADICRYLGNDALVRPGNYKDPATGRLLEGYLIKAYRNLTSEMIADLKTDSQRWENERRETASRTQPTGVDYVASTTHAQRHYGPSEAGSPPYMPQEQPMYDNGQAYANPYAMQGGPDRVPATYAQQQNYIPAVEAANNRYYVSGGDRHAVPPAAPRNPGYGQPQQYVQEARGGVGQYYSPPPPQTTPQQYQSQPDAFYNSRGPSSGYDTMDYEQNYQQQAPQQPQAADNNRRRHREEPRETERDGGHRQRRRQ